MNFVFIVEGKQDKSRLPLLLKKYYGETCDKDGNLQRIAIITTNSCTNIKTYANLKYMNQIYLKDNFLMIRDGETCDKDGNLQRIAIITTNSCTNIKTYANLKYMNQIYLKDNFLMIRDGDGEILFL